MSAQGICKSFNGLKGWGFITYGGTDIFVHIKDCTGGQPKQGDLLTFDLQPRDNNPTLMQAKNVSGGTAEREQDKGKGKGSGPVQGTGVFTGVVKTFNGILIATSILS